MQTTEYQTSFPTERNVTRMYVTFYKHTYPDGTVKWCYVKKEAGATHTGFFNQVISAEFDSPAEAVMNWAKNCFFDE